jgi:benzoyl-CoA reductase/2-hydroxyglutaryl-CoA dehydratase subunit BcrC/BadD/HgdB
MYSKTDILYPCSYLPQEVITAASLRPIRLIPDMPPAKGDSLIHSLTCPYIRSIAALGLSGGLSSAGAVAVVNACDGMRRLSDALRRQTDTAPVFFLDVPKKRNNDAVDFFTASLWGFVEGLNQAGIGSRVTSDSLQAAIGMYNKLPRHMGELFTLQKQPEYAISGSDVLSLMSLQARADIDNFIDHIQRTISDTKTKRTNNKQKSIVVSGNVLNRPDLIEAVEGLGARVTALDICWGERHYDGMVSEGSSDPMHAIAERYLTRPPCPRMEGIEDYVSHLIKLVETSSADGVIISTVRYCDQLLYSIPTIIRSLQERAIPVLVLENDYEWSGHEQLVTRVEAFLEVLRQGDRNA